MKDSKLEKTRKAIAEYRNIRKNRKDPIPDKLKDKILGHLGQYSVPDLAGRLGIAECLIYKWKKNQNTLLHKEELPQISPFVELAIDQASLNLLESSTGSSLVEFSRPDGAIMRIPMDLQRETLAILIANFFGGLSPC